MDLTIEYRGALGFGSVEVSISDAASIKELITAFHQKIEISEFYSIGAGAPPFRRTISVGYEYRITSDKTPNGISKITDANLKEYDTIIIEVRGGGKVD